MRDRYCNIIDTTIPSMESSDETQHKDIPQHDICAWGHNSRPEYWSCRVNEQSNMGIRLGL